MCLSVTVQNGGVEGEFFECCYSVTCGTLKSNVSFHATG